ncbi:NAD(P)-binding protein [Polychaeton citri CBS 116435]|uniref:NAD(P)-binding protein n=1 Tax=Polychaeton citri CBS 116435 TaxID=1314669 RepID=A0A9P4US70_9PEZI|nr:NAD(P)-binding protein [Polychaeton citri CBS 116435]
MAQEIKKVALLGADGKLGPSILDALLANNFTVTVLKRESSSSPSNYPSSVTVTRCPDAFDVDSLVPILQGQDALVISIKGSQVGIQKRLSDAALQAGVQRVIPADFGSCDSAAQATQDLVPLYKAKTEIREYLQGLVDANPGAAFGWTAIVPAHFFDWQLSFLHLYPAEKRADMLGDGEIKHSLSTLGRIGEATARALVKAAETRNRMLYVQSFRKTQVEVIRAFEKAAGEKWEVTKLDPDAFVKEEKRKADAGDADAVEDCVWYLGVVDADWPKTKGEDFAMELLGLEDEDLEEVAAKVLKQVQGSKD